MTDIFDEFKEMAIELNRRITARTAIQSGYSSIQAVEEYNTPAELIADRTTTDEALCRLINMEEIGDKDYKKILLHPNVGQNTLFEIAKNIKASDGTLKIVLEKAILVRDCDTRYKIRSAVLANRSASFFTKMHAKNSIKKENYIKNAKAGYTPMMD